MGFLFELLDAYAAWRKRREEAKREAAIKKFEADLLALANAGTKAAATIARGKLPK